MHRLTATDTPMVRYTRTIFPSYAPIMAEEYKDQSENPNTQNMTFEERFESMVIKEYDSRINHTVERYIKLSLIHI